MKQIRFFKHENLVYILNRKIDLEIMKKFSNLVKLRRLKICKLLNLKIPKNQVFYFINFNTLEKKHGYADKNCIYIYIENEKELLTLYYPVFIHEETHNITLWYWPQLNDLLIEGIAEYCLFNFTKKVYLPIYMYYYPIFHRYSSHFLLEKNGKNRPQLNYLGNILVHFIVEKYTVEKLKELLNEYSKSQLIKSTKIYNILEKNFFNVLYYSIGYITLRFFSNDEKIKYFYKLFSGNERLIRSDDKYINVEILDYNNSCKIIPEAIKKLKHNYIGSIAEMDVRFFYNSFLIVFDYKKEKMYIGIHEEKIYDNLYLMFTQIKDIVKRIIINDQIAVLHAALLVKKRKNIIIIGESGAGKSTLAYKIFKKEKYEIANDDILVFDFIKKEIIARTNSIFLTEESLNLLNVSNLAISLGKSFKKRLIVNDTSCKISNIDVLIVLTKEPFFYYSDNKVEILKLIRNNIFSGVGFNNIYVIDSLMSLTKKCFILSYDKINEIKKIIE